MENTILQGKRKVSELNLEKLFQTQKVLRDRIGYNEPDRFNKLILALLVELGECANEWRGFKFWSVNQIPHTSAVRVPAMMEEDKEYYNPLLEEYVDGLHFLLELGLEIGFNEYEFLEGSTNVVCSVEKLFISVYAKVTDLLFPNDKHMMYISLFMQFNQLGRELGFTQEEIEQAYFAKNKINHVRQATGY
jgi:dimeric dUTPase (all-alpha-NTP-PPase superfamily)